MKFSENWLRTIVNPPLASRELADVLLMSGIDVEAVEPAAPACENVVVAEVIEVQKHPDAERLTVCRVNAGGAPLTVVCGAENVAAGMRVPLARAGARLSGIEIKKTKVRGVESSGMLCSAKELGLAEDVPGLLLLPVDAPIGTDIRNYLELDDHLITIKPTPNRGDCLSINGIAREVAAITGSVLKPVATPAVHAASSDRIEIEVEEKSACPRYCGRIVRGVNARAATPRWMVQRLERSGSRSVSAIVDVTNYVMLELGQPLHAFDYARIDGGIRVRFGYNDEKLTLLNGTEIALDAKLLVIADARKPLALAGIMGGKDSAVTLDTGDVLLEGAFFDPAVIAGKARELGLSSDSSYRFERGVDFAATLQAMERATQLVLEICGGTAGPVCEASATLPLRKPLRLRRARAQRLLGIELSNQQIAAVFRRLGFEFDAHGDDFIVTPPSFRFDLAIEEDLIEEVARVHGYDKIPAEQPSARSAMLPATETHVGVKTLRTLLVARDYQEIVSYSFVDREWEIDFCANEDPIALINPIAAQLNVMRSSLIGSLVNCLKLNLSRQQERVRLCEIGRCFSREQSGYRQDMMLGGLAYGGAVAEQWGAPKRNVDFYDVKSDVGALTRARDIRFEAAHHPAFHPGRAARIFVGGAQAGWIGELHPRLQQKYDLPLPPMAFELNLEIIASRKLAHYLDYSRQPVVRRDISVEVPQEVNIQTMLDSLKKRAPKIVCEVALFDLYRGKGIDSDKKSVAFRLLLQDTHKTLTDAEAEAAKQQLVHVLQEEFQAKLRK
jgi:phenylalanyl-tRNA synthetase beta chain